MCHLHHQKPTLFASTPLAGRLSAKAFACPPTACRPPLTFTWLVMTHMLTQLQAEGGQQLWGYCTPRAPLICLNAFGWTPLQRGVRVSPQHVRPVNHLHMGGNQDEKKIHMGGSDPPRACMTYITGQVEGLTSPWCAAATSTADHPPPCLLPHPHMHPTSMASNRITLAVASGGCDAHQ
jgi:hypothetical protein